MLRIQTQEHIKALNDVDLIEYSRDSDYEPEAVAFAYAEIQRRNLNTEQYQQMQVIADVRLENRETERAAAAIRPLGCRGRILAFLAGYTFIGCIGWCLPALLAAGHFANRGERAKRVDVWRFILGGFGALAVSILILNALPIGPWLVPMWLGCCALEIAGIVLFSPKPETPAPRGFPVRME
jgi:hypothetical protein